MSSLVKKLAEDQPCRRGFGHGTLGNAQLDLVHSFLRLVIRSILCEKRRVRRARLPGETIRIQLPRSLLSIISLVLIITLTKVTMTLFMQR